MKKIVNGVEVDMSPQEIADRQAEWDANDIIRIKETLERHRTSAMDNLKSLFDQYKENEITQDRQIAHLMKAVALIASGQTAASNTYLQSFVEKVQRINTRLTRYETRKQLLIDATTHAEIDAVPDHLD